MRRLVAVFSFALAGLVVAGCSSGTTTASTGALHPTTTTTNVTGTVHVGNPQTATGPSGQKVSATAGNPGHTGYAVGGPPGSWYVGLIVTNEGPGAFASVPASQVGVVVTSGESWVPEAKGMGRPTYVGVGQQARDILIVVLPAGAMPAAVTYAPFGPSGTTLRWST